MRRHFDYRGLAPQDRGAAVAIGNFDGVHLGHQSVLALARAAAADRGTSFGVVTFEPHPRAFFVPGGPPFRLMNAEAKAHQLAELGVEELYELPFDARLAAMEADAFVRDVLTEGLGIRHLVAGEDFRFGKGRGGDVATLRRLGPELGFGLTVAPLVSAGHGDLSSTAIRAALSEGRPGDAAHMLGHWHRIEGRVQRGDRRGRTLGYPTANLWLDGLHLPRFGVYAVTVEVVDGAHRGRYGGAASLGVRPTFGGERPNLEVYLLDFDGDLYDAEISVALIAFQRPELAFEEVAALVAQMRLDVAESRERLAQLAWGSGDMIVTERLVLRPWEPRDRAPFAALNADPKVRAHFPGVLDRAGSDAQVDRLEAAWATDGFGLAAVERRSDAAFLGMAGIGWARFDAPVCPCVEIGWRLAREHWGHGYATEAARAWLAHGFAVHGLDEIVAFTVPGNLASQAVMARLGMVHDPARDFDHPDLPEAHPLRPHVVYALTHAAWALGA